MAHLKKNKSTKMCLHYNLPNIVLKSCLFDVLFSDSTHGFHIGDSCQESCSQVNATTIHCRRPMAVAQLVVRKLPIPEVYSSNPVIIKIHIEQFMSAVLKRPK